MLNQVRVNGQFDLHKPYVDHAKQLRMKADKEMFAYADLHTTTEDLLDVPNASRLGLNESKRILNFIGVDNPETGLYIKTFHHRHQPLPRNLEELYA